MKRAAEFTFVVEGLGRELRVVRFTGEEGISELFHFELVLASEDADLGYEDVIGRPALLTLLGPGAPRLVHGVVSRFAQGDEGKRLTIYHATLVPTVSRLVHRNDCRIFQGLSVPEIVARVLAEAGVPPEGSRFVLEKPHAAREYCVQYRESDHAFVSRLLEDEGLFYYFEHDAARDVLTIGDTVRAHEPIPAPATLPFRPAGGLLTDGEGLSRFRCTGEVRPGKVTLRDYNFKNPGLSLEGGARAGSEDALEVYDYPGGHETPSAGHDRARLRLEQIRAVRETIEAESTCMRLVPGFVFGLADHPREAFNRRHLVTRLQHEGAQPQIGEGAGAEGLSYANRISAIPAAVPFRPPSRTARPTVKGIQTAVVVGPAGEEIHTDEHGRVKVQFFWDRRGRHDDGSSCWIRVSQAWAGPAWGAMAIPRIGHEVVVDFLEGDPDRPLIVGRVYHGTNIPPYVLPTEKTKSTLRSSTSPGGEGSNELRFEDRAGAEQVYLHAQKDWSIVVENDEARTIGRDETLAVGRDRSKRIGHDQREAVGNDQTVAVGGDHAESVAGSETLSVGGTRTKTVGGGQTEVVGGNKGIEVGGSHAESIGGAMSLSVGADKKEGVGGKSHESVGADKTLAIGQRYDLTIAAGMSTMVDGDQATDVKGHKTVIAGESITLRCGDASVVLQKNGDLTIHAKDLTVEATGRVQVKSDKDVDVRSAGNATIKADGCIVMKAPKILQN